MTATITWPPTFSLTSFLQQEKIQQFLMELSGKVLATCCICGDDLKELLKKLYVDEVVQHRMTIGAIAPNSYHRVASKSAARLSDWQNTAHKTYTLLTSRPVLTKIEFENLTEGKSDADLLHDGKPPQIKDHRFLRVQSIIDVHAWDKADWKGMLYEQSVSSQPPCMAFIFKDEEAARIIFEKWKERFDSIDQNEEISISIIRKLPQQSQYHYCIQVTSKMPEEKDFNYKKIVTAASRSKMMEANNDTNLEAFLASYNRFGEFYLMPAIFQGTAMPKLLTDLAILKRSIAVKMAANIGDHDIEAVALRSHRKQ
jgi:hypothetical protein